MAIINFKFEEIIIKVFNLIFIIRYANSFESFSFSNLIAFLSKWEYDYDYD